MTFTVTYRGTDGAICEEVVEAAGRAECFARMKARGITPIAVKEGGRDRAQPSRKAVGSRVARDRRASGTLAPAKRRTIPYVLSVALVALIIGGGVWWWAARSASAPYRPTEPKKPTKTDIVKPKIQHEAKHAAKPIEASSAKPVEETPAAKLPKRSPPPGTVLSVRTNDNDLVISEVVGPDGKTNLVTTALHEPVFSNLADQLIATVMNASMTGQMAPLPLGPETDWQFKAAMKKPIFDNPDDSDEVKRMKQVVREAREQIAALMDQGHSFAEILAEHRELWNENIKIREGVVAEYRKIVKSGDEAEARHYLNTMNAALGQMGIPPLTENDGHSRRRRTRKAKQDEY